MRLVKLIENDFFLHMWRDKNEETVGVANFIT